jgi:hypothetical protein
MSAAALMKRGTGGGDGESLAVLLPEVVRDLVAFVGRALDQQELRIMERVAKHLGRMLDLIGRVRP